MIEKLKNADFNLSVIQDDPTPSGYTLRLRASWRKIDGWAPHYVVKLIGMNPLTGRDLATENITRTFTFDRNSHIMDGLRYHGAYTFLCYAILPDGTEHLVKEQPVNLKFPDSCPRLSYNLARRGSFVQVTMKSNCWEYCSGRVWLKFGGQDQPVYFPKNTEESYSFFLNTTEEPTITIMDSEIKIERGA